ncbi:hypothetical protein D3P08_07935 [Paenibacillus nanensis]|uniref:Uncharacterized protein n=1 Tax=Paenibacillus nanensis TaxID=393251 RepID=A0A3A1V459_9BACL|nr:hypothetical protein [Paenibacillus nanensis]RIX54162.1 hypothetical protein D3P08_07935 [Paenibacillus nanensis]
MFWTVIWFVVNTLFVAAAIAFLFMHRAVTLEKQQGSSAERLKTLVKRRNVTAVLSILLFIAMCASFVVNMKING